MEKCRDVELCHDERMAAQYRLLECLRSVRMYEETPDLSFSDCWPDETRAEEDNDVQIVHRDGTKSSPVDLGDGTKYSPVDVDEETFEEGVEKTNLYNIKKEKETGTE